MTEKKLHTPVTLSLWRWLVPCILDWFGIIALFVIGYVSQSYGHPLIWIPIVVLLGGFQHRLAVLGHEGAHFLISRNQRWNDLLAETLCTWPLGVGLDGFRRFHLHHHRTVGTPEDPELAPKFGVARPSLLIFLVDLTGWHWRETRKIAKVTGKASRADHLGPLLWMVGVSGILILTGYWLVPLLWLFAMHSSFWAFFRMRIETEHNADPVCIPWFVRWASHPHNIGLHDEHHERPGLPFWRLRQARLVAR